jgi:hypothetical protein
MTNINFLPIDVEVLIKRTAQATAELLKNELTPKKNTSNDLLTPKEASDLLRCSITTLWRHEKAGKVKSSTIGGKRLYRRADLLEALKM